MQKDIAKARLSELLETRYCDAENAEEHESLLRKYASNYLDKFDFERKAKVFAALADKSRLKILHLLTFRAMCVCELTVALKMTQPNLTYHIRKIENVGLVERKKEGKWVYYSLTAREYLRQIEIL